jgi:hypothetical protein
MGNGTVLRGKVVVIGRSFLCRVPETHGAGQLAQLILGEDVVPPELSVVGQLLRIYLDWECEVDKEL